MLFTQNTSCHFDPHSPKEGAWVLWDVWRCILQAMYCTRTEGSWCISMPALSAADTELRMAANMQEEEGECPAACKYTHRDVGVPA